MSVKEILMQRDEMTSKEAENAIAEAREAILSADPFEADEIMMSYLGLEPDYIMDILGF